VPATRPYTAAVSATIRSTVKRSRTRARPAWPIRARSPSSVRRRTIAPAIAVMAGRDEQAVVAVHHHFRNAPDARRDDRLRARHGIEQRRAESFGHRAHRKYVEALDAPQDVGPEPREEHVLFEMMIANLTLQLFAQLAFSEDDESGVGNLAHDQLGGFDEMALSFVRHERGDAADDRRVTGKPERFVDVDSRRAEDVIHVDPLVNRDRPVGGNAVTQQDPADRF
jgi:hypothetical protein